MTSSKLFILSIAVTAIVSGCATHPDSEAPPGLSLAGGWKLDKSASDDPEKLIAHLRAEVKKNRHRRSNQSFAMGGMGMGRHGHGQGGAGQGGAGPGDSQDENQDVGTMGTGGDRLSSSVAMHTLLAFIQRGDYLTVQQGPGEFQLTYDSGSSFSYTPGEHSVVSDETGVADQVSGWKGKEYVIDVKPQVGPDVTQEYALSPDHQHLIVKLHVAASDVPEITLKQVYDRTTHAPPPDVPST